MVKQIPLTQGKVALVDDDDYEALAAHKWCAHRIKSNWYAGRSTPTGYVYMHMVVMGGKGIDHIDGDGLNNQRANLRFATPAQNACNARLSRASTSGHKGVSWVPSRKRWQVTIQVDGKKRWLGFYKNLEDAVAIRVAAQAELHGEFAR